MPVSLPAVAAPCAHCGGCGSVKLPRVYGATLEAVKASKSNNSTSKEITARLAKQGDTATISTVHNRLARLVTLGLVTRRRDAKAAGGLEYVYSAVKGKKR